MSYGPGEPQARWFLRVEFVRLEGSHKNRLYQRRHALILWAVEKNQGPALSQLAREEILLPIVVPINSFPPSHTININVFVPKFKW